MLFYFKYICYEFDPCSCHAIHRCEKVYNKYLKNYDKDNKSSYIMYLDANNLYGWAMSQNMDVDGFK